ncbi:hypothetical protein [Butyrivibrio sp. FC2001]|uniref:hypothetical protein n=1 Tax=Butyrivibrio sp. FC2001 TaxID=1280671 RepID=UPI000406511E|nr:hypothetical protein [Butyrivibrio sp. FC2001]
MLELSKVKQVQNIGTYNYNSSNSASKAKAGTTSTNGTNITTSKVSGAKEVTKTQKTNVPAKTNKAQSSANKPKTQSFQAHLNNAAATPQLTSNSDYTAEEWDAQRKKNSAISKLQKTDADVAALERVAPNASEEVKSAWMDASEETGTNGLGYDEDPSKNTATRLYAEINNSAKMTDNSVSGVQDILGGTVDSAIDAVSSAKQDRVNMTGDDSDTADKEVEFYDELLENLNGIKDGTYEPSDKSTFDRMNKNNMAIFPVDDSPSASAMDIPDRYSENYFFHSTTSSDENGVEFELKAKYPADYDPTNPKIEVYSSYDGKENLYEVDVNSVNPETASQTELYGLFAYVEDDKNIPRTIDPNSSDLYYSALDRKLEVIHQDDSKNVNSNNDTELAATMNTFRTMDNLSYWDKKELLESVYNEG